MMMAGNFSVATIAALSKIVRTCRNLRHVIGREPTAEEIAGRLRMPPETIRKLLEASPPPRIEMNALLPIAPRPYSGAPITAPTHVFRGSINPCVIVLQHSQPTIECRFFDLCDAAWIWHTSTVPRTAHRETSLTRPSQRARLGSSIDRSAAVSGLVRWSFSARLRQVLEPAS